MGMEILEAGGAPTHYAPESEPGYAFRECQGCEDCDPDVAPGVTVKRLARRALLALRSGCVPERAFVTERDPAVSRASWQARWPPRTDPMQPEYPWTTPDPDHPEGPFAGPWIPSEVVRDRVVGLLHELAVPIFVLPYEALVDDPRPVCEGIAKFLGRKLDIGAMVAVPKKSLRHFPAGA